MKFHEMKSKNTLRAFVIETGVPVAFSASDQREFARQLDRYLAK